MTVLANHVVIAVNAGAGAETVSARRKGEVVSSRTTSALALLEARPPRTPWQCISVVVAADAGIANDRMELQALALLDGAHADEAAPPCGFLRHPGLLDGWGRIS